MTVKLFIKTETTKGMDKDIVKVTWGAVNNSGRVSDCRETSMFFANGFLINFLCSRFMVNLRTN